MYIRVVDLDFGRIEVNYANRALLQGKDLCLADSRDAPASKSFLEVLCEKADKKGHIDYGCDTPHVYRIPVRKVNFFAGTDVAVVCEHIVKHSITEVEVAFEITTEQDSKENKTRLLINFDLPESEDPKELQDLLFKEGLFIYKQYLWKDLIIGKLIDGAISDQEELKLNRTQISELSRSFGRLKNYVKDLAKVLTPDMPEAIFDCVHEKDQNWQLVTGALKSISNKIAGLLPKDKKVVEERAPAIATKPMIGLGNHDFDGDQLNAARMASKMMLHGMYGAHGDTHFAAGDMVMQFRSDHPLVFGNLIWSPDMGDLFTIRGGDKHLLSRLIDTQK